MKEKILIADDEQFIRWSLKENLTKAGYDVVEAENGSNALKVFSDSLPDLVLLDVNLPDVSGIEVLRSIKNIDKDVPVIIITAFGNIQLAVDAMKVGASDFVEKPFEMKKLHLVLEKAFENAFLRREVMRYKAKDGEYSFETIIGNSPKIQELTKVIKKIVTSNATTVLLEGETGTGKDFFARVIHDQSSRAHKSFIDVNCAALPENLIESELFGYERGAFTGANAFKKGLFEISSGGTIYLDEIGDMNYDFQAKLLKVIDSKTFRRLGGTSEITTDVRIIAATNRDLRAKVKDGTFREDLYWRLKVMPLHLPPLREREEDILLLSQNIIERLNTEFKKQIKGLSPDAKKAFVSYMWPGNVRELKNAIERAMILETREYISLEHIPVEIFLCREEQPSKSAAEEFDIDIPDGGLDIEKVERELLRKALSMAKGNQSKAAKLLNLGRDAFRYRAQKFGLENGSKGES